MAFAHAVNLKRSDVPGAVATSREQAAEEPAAHAAVVCDVRQPREVVNIRSSSFKTGRELRLTEVYSDVGVAPTTLLADQDLADAQAADANAAIRACFARTFTRAFGKGAKAKPSPDTRITVGRSVTAAVHPSTPRSFGLRINIPFTVTFAGASGAIHDAVRAEILGFVTGRAAVELGALTAGAPLSATRDARLLSLLYTRATTHPLRGPS